MATNLQQKYDKYIIGAVFVVGLFLLGVSIQMHLSARTKERLSCYSHTTY